MDSGYQRRALKRNDQRGLVLLELLLALAVVTFIGLIGSRIIFVLLDILGSKYGSTSEQIRFGLFESELRRAWDARLDHSFQADEWLKISGESIPEGYELKRFRMRMIGQNGEVLLWTLQRTEGVWEYFRIDEATGSRVGDAAQLDYAGDIIVGIENLHWPGGSIPTIIRWRFPSGNYRHLQQGFAIRPL